LVKVVSGFTESAKEEEMKQKFLNVIVCTVLLVAALAITPPANVTAQQNPQAIHVGLISSFSQLDPGTGGSLENIR
jgi:hypothetical protein